MEETFYIKSITCCTIELNWKDYNSEENDADSYEYELYQKEGGDHFISNIIYFKKIYQGVNNNYEALRLKSNETYTFKLLVKLDKKEIEEKKITVKTLKRPSAILSERSEKIANGESINYTYDLTDSQKKIVKHCAKLIFGGSDNNFLKGNFEGIEIKITQHSESNIYYISFDISSDYFDEFFQKYIEELENDVIIPCYFLLQKLPTILILNLLEKGPVILTGKRMGGVIASSLAFYIMNFGKSKSLNKKYSNSLMYLKENSIGVITFGSPTFLKSLTAGIKIKELAPYFINIKEEFDYIPEIIDFIDKEKEYQNLLSIFQKLELNNNDTTLINNFLILNDITEENLKSKIKTLKIIPFGKYFMMKSINNNKYDLNSINELMFEEFYYFKIFHSDNGTTDLKIYENLSSKITFTKEHLQYLESKDLQIDLVKIIRRIDKNNKKNQMKGIIKFKLIKYNDISISPDIIYQIKLISNNNIPYLVYNKNIYYDNDTDVTAYIDDLNSNINKVIIYNNFGGEIKVNHILNIRGSGSTREMIKVNVEKLFLIPFFKLFEIFYLSLKDSKKYEKLKEENFGINLNELEEKILKPFRIQIKIFDELLLLSRPDILGKFENKFINEYFCDKLTNKGKIHFNNKLKEYYEQALKLQEDLSINCIDSEQDSIAKKSGFPKVFKDKNETKKLFMGKFQSFNFDNFLEQKFEDCYIRNFFLVKLISKALEEIENEIKKNLNNLNDEKECKEQIQKTIGVYYHEYIEPNINFIILLILSSIESGDYIQFNHNISFEKLKIFLKYTSTNIYGYFTPLKFISFFALLPFFSFEKDFKKNYSKDKIEEIYANNIFYKKRIKNIVNSNISSNEVYDLFLNIIFRL